MDYLLILSRVQLQSLGHYKTAFERRAGKPGRVRRLYLGDPARRGIENLVSPLVKFQR